MENAGVCERLPERDDRVEAATAEADAVTESHPESRRRGYGALRGRIDLAEGFDELPDDIAEAVGQK